VYPPGEIDRSNGERFIHRHDEIARSVDPSAIPERRRDGFTKSNANVFHGVMLIDVEVAVGHQLQVERAMARKQLEHVIEEPDSRVHVVTTLAIE
jgi:hypothetical protein